MKILVSEPYFSLSLLIQLLFPAILALTCPHCTLRIPHCPFQQILRLQKILYFLLDYILIQQLHTKKGEREGKK